MTIIFISMYIVCVVLCLYCSTIGAERRCYKMSLIIIIIKGSFHLNHLSKTGYGILPVYLFIYFYLFLFFSLSKQNHHQNVMTFCTSAISPYCKLPKCSADYFRRRSKDGLTNCAACHLRPLTSLPPFQPEARTHFRRQIEARMISFSPHLL